MDPQAPIEEKSLYGIANFTLSFDNFTPKLLATGGVADIKILAFLNGDPSRGDEAGKRLQDLLTIYQKKENPAPTPPQLDLDVNAIRKTINEIMLKVNNGLTIPLPPPVPPPVPPAPPAPTSETLFFTPQLVQSLDVLMKSLKAAGFVLPTGTETLLPLTATQIAEQRSALIRWKDIAENENTLKDLINMVGDIKTENNVIPLNEQIGFAGKSLQEMLELDYVAKGTQLTFDDLDAVKNRQLTSKDALTLLTDIQNLHNEVSPVNVPDEDKAVAFIDLDTDTNIAAISTGQTTNFQTSPGGGVIVENVTEFNKKKDALEAAAKADPNLKFTQVTDPTLSPQLQALLSAAGADISNITATELLTRAEIEAAAEKMWNTSIVMVKETTKSVFTGPIGLSQIDYTREERIFGTIGAFLGGDGLITGHITNRGPSNQGLRDALVREGVELGTKAFTPLFNPSEQNRFNNESELIDFRKNFNISFRGVGNQTKSINGITGNYTLNVFKTVYADQWEKASESLGSTDPDLTPPLDFSLQIAGLSGVAGLGGATSDFKAFEFTVNGKTQKMPPMQVFGNLKGTNIQEFLSQDTRNAAEDDAWATKWKRILDSYYVPVEVRTTESDTDPELISLSNPTGLRVPDFVNTFSDLRKQTQIIITKLRTERLEEEIANTPTGGTPVTDATLGAPQSGTLEAALLEVVSDMGGTETPTSTSIRRWIVDGWPNTEFGTDGIENRSAVQNNLRTAITSGANLNDELKEELRKTLFIFEEFYKSASAVLAKISQIIEKLSGNISR